MESRSNGWERGGLRDSDVTIAGKLTAVALHSSGGDATNACVMVVEMLLRMGVRVQSSKRASHVLDRRDVIGGEGSLQLRGTSQDRGRR